MYRARTRLADGRELIYYDRAGARADLPADPRPLPAQVAGAGMRQDPATGDWVAVAGHRQGRGWRPAADDCPLCPSRPGHPSEIPATDYDVVVFENRFPALTGSPPRGSGGSGDLGLRGGTGGGRCEVICFSSRHDTSFADLTAAQAGLVLAVWQDRTRDLAALPDVAQVFCFENRGAEMGVSQPHPHGQIYALPVVTPRTARMLARAAEHRRRYARNLFEDIVAAELADGNRVVAHCAQWVAFVPYAARWPYEVHLYPRRRRTDLTGLDQAQRDAFPAIYLDLLRRFERLDEQPTPYVSAWHQAPGPDRTGDFALHLELFTNRRGPQRLKVLGATEVAMDTFSNDIAPEQAALRLRQLADPAAADPAAADPGGTGPAAAPDRVP